MAFFGEELGKGFPGTIPGAISVPLVVVGIPLGLVGTVVLVSGWGPVGSGSGGVQGGQMGGLGVLNFGGLNRHSVVDHRDVLGSVPGSGSVPSGSGRGAVPGWGGRSGMTGAGSGMGGKVLGLGVLNFGRIDRTGTDVSAGGLVGGEVLGLGGGHFGGVGRDVVPVVGRRNGGQQQDGSDDESLHFE